MMELSSFKRWSFGILRRLTVRCDGDERSYATPSRYKPPVDTITGPPVPVPGLDISLMSRRPLAGLNLRLGTPLVLPEGYGFVILMGFTSVLLLAYKLMRVREARRDFKVPVPLTHSEYSMMFNNFYRALHSTMEIYPQFLFMLMTGGLEMPYCCSISGFIWILGRFFYARAFYSGEPENRYIGYYYLIGHVMIGIATLRFAVRRLFL